MEKVRTYLAAHYQWFIWLAFPLLSLAMHAHLFPLPLQGIHAWRQCETASNIVLYAQDHHHLWDPHVYSLEWPEGLKRMEFPIMQWLIAQPIRAFGHEVWVMRSMSWLLGFLTVIGFFRLVDLIFRDKFLALVGAWCWMFSPVIFYYSINPLPDNFSLMAAVWGMALFLKWFRQGSPWAMLGSFACISLATATKLPFAVFMTLPMGGLLGQLVREKGAGFPKVLMLGLAGLALLGPALWWYAWVIPQWTGNGVVKGILDSTREDIPVILKAIANDTLMVLPELLLNYASVGFFLWGIWKIGRDRLYLHALALPFGLLALSIVAYFLFEINMITSVHDYYLFPFLPGIFILVVVGMRGLQLPMMPRWVRSLTLALLLALPVTAGLRAYSRWSTRGMPADLLTQTAALQAVTPPDAKIIFGNDLSPHISLYHLQRFGWTIDESTLNPEKLAQYFEGGAQYLYSTSRKLEENAWIKPHLGQMKAEIGVTKVWELLR